jgi:zinc protease
MTGFPLRVSMLRVVTAAALVTVALATSWRSAAAQTLDRSKQPVAPPAAPFRFPTTHSQTLRNGLRVLVVENHALPLVTVRAVVDVDSLGDPPGKGGLFALTSAMLREGTTSMTAEQQSEATAELGNAVSPFSFTTTTQNAARSLDLMADMLQHPSFPQAAFDRRKATSVAAQQKRSQAPATAAWGVFYGRILGEADPLARTFAASDSSITSLSRADVQAFYDAHFHPGNTTVIVVGDVRTADAVNDVRRRFEHWPAAPVPAVVAAPAVAAHPTTIYLIDQPGAKQTQMAVGIAGPVRSSRDFAALDVMGYVLGAVSGSRLQQNLREQHSYMYSGVPATIDWRRGPYPSIIGGLVPVNPAKTDSALIEWLAEIRGMRTRAPTADEMQLAKGLLVGRLPFDIETIGAIANRLTEMVKEDLPLDYYDGFVRRVNAVTPSDVTAAARKYLDPDHLVIVVAGDRKLIEPQLRALAEQRGWRVEGGR